MMKNHKPSSLTAHFGRLLLLSAAAGILLFLCLRLGGEVLLTHYIETSDYQVRATEKQVREFQSYVSEKGLAVRDSVQITKWVRRHAPILMEIYRDNIMLYSSSAPEELEGNDEESPSYDWISYYQVHFADGPAEVVLYADILYPWLSILTIASLVLSFTLFLLLFLRGCRGLIRYICQLSAEIQAMEGGDLDVAITIRDDHELTRLARSLDAMRLAFREQRAQETAIFQANQRMITEMSHDLRTPLTTLQIYTDILRLGRYEPDQLPGYLEKIDAKAGQIRQLAENIFEYSLVSRHQEIRLGDPAPVREVFHDLLSECVGNLKGQGFTVEFSQDWPAVSLAVYQPYIKRLIDNIHSNLLKYADPGAPVQIRIREEKNAVCLSVENRISSDTGDRDGTQIGLTNMRTMMEKMGGWCRVEQEEEVFRIRLGFPTVPPDPAEK